MATENKQEAQSEANTDNDSARREDASQREDAPHQRARVAFTSPLSLMGRWVDDLSHIFDSFGPSIASRTGFASLRHAKDDSSWSPAIEVFEKDGQLIVRADVPGLEASDIKVEIEDNTLVISGERESEHEETRGELYSSERSYGSFYRAIPLPEPALLDEVAASFKNGVLEIALPLEQSESRRRTIDVRAADKSSTHARS